MTTVDVLHSPDMATLYKTAVALDEQDFWRLRLYADEYAAVQQALTSFGHWKAFMGGAKFDAWWKERSLLRVLLKEVLPNGVAADEVQMHPFDINAFTTTRKKDAKGQAAAKKEASVSGISMDDVDMELLQHTVTSPLLQYRVRSLLTGQLIAAAHDAEMRRKLQPSKEVDVDEDGTEEKNVEEMAEAVSGTEVQQENKVHPSNASPWATDVRLNDMYYSLEHDTEDLEEYRVVATTEQGQDPKTRLRKLLLAQQEAIRRATPSLKSSGGGGGRSKGGRGRKKKSGSSKSSSSGNNEEEEEEGEVPEGAKTIPVGVMYHKIRALEEAEPEVHEELGKVYADVQVKNWRELTIKQRMRSLNTRYKQANTPLDEREALVRRQEDMSAYLANVHNANSFNFFPEYAHRTSSVPVLTNVPRVHRQFNPASSSGSGLVGGGTGTGEGGVSVGGDVSGDGGHGGREKVPHVQIRVLHARIVAECERVQTYGSKNVTDFGNEQTVEIEENGMETEGASGSGRGGTGGDNVAPTPEEEAEMRAGVRIVHQHELPRWRAGQSLPAGVYADDRVMHKVLSKGVTRALLMQGVGEVDKSCMDVLTDVVADKVHEFARTMRILIDTHRRTTREKPAHAMARALELVYDVDYSQLDEYVRTEVANESKLRGVASRLLNVFRQVTLDWDEADQYDEEVGTLDEDDLKLLRQEFEGVFDEFDLGEVEEMSKAASALRKKLRRKYEGKRRVVDALGGEAGVEVEEARAQKEEEGQFVDTVLVQPTPSNGEIKDSSWSLDKDQEELNIDVEELSRMPEETSNASVVHVSTDEQQENDSSSNSRSRGLKRKLSLEEDEEEDEDGDEEEDDDEDDEEDDDDDDEGDDDDDDDDDDDAFQSPRSRRSRGRTRKDTRKSGSARKSGGKSGGRGTRQGKRSRALAALDSEDDSEWNGGEDDDEDDEEEQVQTRRRKRRRR